jgi:hypothetical protein
MSKLRRIGFTLSASGRSAWKRLERSMGIIPQIKSLKMRIYQVGKYDRKTKVNKLSLN